MQIVEQGSPFWIVSKDGVSEPDDGSMKVSADGELVDPRRPEAVRPHLESLRNNVAVKV
jgi:hypothetical protein